MNLHDAIENPGDWGCMSLEYHASLGRDFAPSPLCERAIICENREAGVSAVGAPSPRYFPPRCLLTMSPHDRDLCRQPSFAIRGVTPVASTTLSTSATSRFRSLGGLPAAPATVSGNAGRRQLRREIQPLLAEALLSSTGPIRAEGGLRLHEVGRVAGRTRSGELASDRAGKARRKCAVRAESWRVTTARRMPPEGEPCRLRRRSPPCGVGSQGANDTVHWAFQAAQRAIAARVQRTAMDPKPDRCL